jgi:isoleucyl-tRNA synthetase
MDGAQWIKYINASPALQRMVGNFDFRLVESNVSSFWAGQGIYEKAKANGEGKPTFYFLDGPPYTSGNVHLGTAWNKILKDMVLRHRRMAGFHVWDRAGYDMHGLPTEHATEKQLNIHGREQIEAYGVEAFIEACRKYCTENMLRMNDVFKSLGVWMDFDGAYQSITREFMEGEWWFVKQAHQKGRLYEGERTMTWDASNATALAKHELEYKTITDTAIYVRLPIVGQQQTYLIIWTTTPWTIPFNLAVMAGPSIVYCKVKLVFQGQVQHWYVAKELLDSFLKDQLHEEYVIEEEMQGADLEGLAYEHPFAKYNPIYAQLKERMPQVHTIILSSEYVDTSSGTGLVHCAPGCGPEDYEVGHRNGIRPFNTIDENGVCRQLHPCEGLEAKKDDDEFIRLISEEGALVHSHRYSHEYPHGERSHEPVIFRTTKQWFLRVEDIKPQLIAENNKIAWIPEAAYNAFNSWLENLRDNSISKQRYWGTPLPIWRNVDDPSDYIVIESASELADLAGLQKVPEDLHIPTVNKIVIRMKGKDGREHEFKRVPDVLDVWVDAGTASWNCLDYPSRNDLLKQWYPAAFIIEGKDQIRGWFNLLHIASMIALDKPAFKACYMHGYINDAQGRKMSKSQGNYILPAEVTTKYGVDATRYYMIGAANPGLDMNYNFEDLDAKFKNLLVFWNMHKYALELAQLADITPEDPSKITLGIEEKYVLSRLNTTALRMNNALLTYRLNEVPGFAEEFLLDLSRTYIQLVRDKATAGTEDEKLAVASVLLYAMRESMALLAPVMPYYAEQVYQNLREAYPTLCPEESVHLLSYPQANEDLIDELLEKDFVIAKDAIAAILAGRDKAQLGVRWPIAAVRIECDEAAKEALLRMRDLILVQTNVKEMSFESLDVTFTVEPNTRTIGKDFGKNTQAVMELITKHQSDIAHMLKERKSSIVLENMTIREHHLHILRAVPDTYQLGEGNALRAYVDTTRTPALEREGYAREIIRRIQQLRKNAGLVKSNRISVEIATADDLLKGALEEHQSSIAERTGASRFVLTATLSQHFTHASTEKIKGISFGVGFSVLQS